MGKGWPQYTMPRLKDPPSWDGSNIEETFPIYEKKFLLWHATDSRPPWEQGQAVLDKLTGLAQTMIWNEFVDQGMDSTKLIAPDAALQILAYFKSQFGDCQRFAPKIGVGKNI